MFGAASSHRCGWTLIFHMASGGYDFYLFYHPISNQFQASTSLLPPSMLSHELILPASIGLGNSSAVGPDMVGQLATAFLDALYKA